MNFQDLHELLRLELLRRIERGVMTGTKLAQQAGFQQAHISNYLNKKRSLSLEGLDRVMAAQELTIAQLLPPAQLPPPETVELQAAGGEGMEAVPVVSSSTAMESAAVAAGAVIESVPIAASQLQGSRARPSPKRAHWERFVAIRVDAQQAAAMEPMLAADTIAVIDRHYCSLAPYRSHQPTLYAVRCGGALVLRFVEFAEGRLVLRPYSRAFPVQMVVVGEGESPGDWIVGRVCVLVAEL